MDEPTAQFFVTVGRLCADASMADLTVRLRLADGTEVAGIPDGPADTEGDGQFDDTGFADELRVADAVIALSDVVAATVHHPRDGAAATT
jgi:hypothetical protein